MNHSVRVALVMGLVMGGIACQPADERLAAIEESQEEILGKLKALEANQKQMLAAPKAPARAQRPTEDPNKIYKISLEGSPTFGNPDARIAIVEYSDFQCPYCARATPLLKEVQKKFPNDVKLVFKHFPLSFHQAARPAAIAAMAAKDQGKFWEMHDTLFENQRSLRPDNMNEMAEKAGLDVERFKKDMESKAADYGKSVDADFREGQAVSVRGTPTIFIGGKKVVNRSVEGMAAMVEAALKEQKGS